MADLEHVRWIRRPELRHPYVIAAFTGWNDAADAASGAVKHLVETMNATPLAEIDPEAFTDFATIRPHVRLSDVGARHIVWPTVSMWTASTPERDLILVLGPEPALQWKAFTQQIIGVAQAYGASTLMSLGALLADVPHRRPTQVLGTAADQAAVDRYDLNRSQYEGPTGIVGVLGDACHRAGMSSVALWAAVPAYAAQIPSPKASLALVEKLAELIDVDLPFTPLTELVEHYDDQIDQLISSDESLGRYLERIENMDDDDDEYEYDEDDDIELLIDDEDEARTELPPDDRPRDDTPLPDGPVDSDALMEEVERFLRSQSDD
ncbi:MAG: PAC2 family protein [Ilumatobacteraceae bacterium]